MTLFRLPVLLPERLVDGLFVTFCLRGCRPRARAAAHGIVALGLRGNRSCLFGCILVRHVLVLTRRTTVHCKSMGKLTATLFAAAALAAAADLTRWISDASCGASNANSTA